MHRPQMALFGALPRSDAFLATGPDWLSAKRPRAFQVPSARQAIGRRCVRAVDSLFRHRYDQDVRARFNTPPVSRADAERRAIGLPWQWECPLSGGVLGRKGASLSFAKIV